MKAMVLCAGYGTRLSDLTRDIPKAMLPLQGRPLLEYIISHLAQQGFTQIIVNLHFKPEQIRDYFKDGTRWGVKIQYSYEAELLGTAGALMKVASFLRQGDLFLAQYGDVLIDQDLKKMLEFHRARRALATLLVHKRARSNSVVSMDEAGRIVGFLERPTEQERAGVISPWVNSGLCACSPEFLDVIPDNVPSDIPRDIIPRIIPTGRLYGFPLSGYRCAIDSPERLEEARSALAEGRCKLYLPVGTRDNNSQSDG